MVQRRLAQRLGELGVVHGAGKDQRTEGGREGDKCALVCPRLPPIRRLTRDQITAAHNGDTKRFADDYQQGVDTQSKLLDAAKAAGVPSCARVPSVTRKSCCGRA